MLFLGKFVKFVLFMLGWFMLCCLAVGWRLLI